MYLPDGGALFPSSGPTALPWAWSHIFVLEYRSVLLWLPSSPSAVLGKKQMHGFEYVVKW